MAAVTVLDPAKLLADTWNKHTRLVSYTEVDVGEGVVVGTLVYECSRDPFDEPTATVYLRAAFVSNSDIGGSDVIVRSWHVDEDAYRAMRESENEASKAKRAAERKERKGRIAAVVAAAPEQQEAFVCPECNHVGDPEEFDEAVYECSRCSSTGRGEEGRRCDQGCGIFRAKVADHSCPSCEATIEETPEVVAAIEVDGELITVAEAGELA